MKSLVYTECLQATVNAINIVQGVVNGYNEAPATAVAFDSIDYAHSGRNISIGICSSEIYEN